MRRSLRFLASASLATLVGVCAAQAQTINAEGATDIENRLNAMLDYVLQNVPDLAFTFSAAPRATPDGASYNLSLPGLTLEHPDVIIELPDFSAEVTPQDNGWFRADWAFPTSLTMRNPRGSEQIDGTFSSDDNTITIAPVYGAALEGDIAFEEMAFTAAGEDATLLIDRLQLDIATDEEDAPHTFSNWSQLDLSGLVLDVPGEALVRLERAAFEGQSDRQRLDLYALMNDRVVGLDPESPGYVNALLDVVSAHRDAKWIAGLQMASSVEALQVEADDVRVEMGRLTAEVDARDLDQPDADLEIALRLDELQTNQTPAELVDVMPTRTVLDLTAENLPIEQMMNVVYDALGPHLDPDSEDAFGPKGRRAGAGPTVERLAAIDPMVLLGILLGSDAELAIDQFHIDAPIGYLDASGTIDPDPDAAFQAVGSMDITIAGLGDIIAFAQQVGGEAAQFAGFASAVAAMGRDGTDADGVAVKTFDLELTPAGQVLLNGNDMSALVGMFR